MRSSLQQYPLHSKGRCSKPSTYDSPLGGPYVLLPITPVDGISIASVDAHGPTQPRSRGPGARAGDGHGPDASGPARGGVDLPRQPRWRAPRVLRRMLQRAAVAVLSATVARARRLRPRAAGDGGAGRRGGDDGEVEPLMLVVPVEHPELARGARDHSPRRPRTSAEFLAHGARCADCASKIRGAGAQSPSADRRPDARVVLCFRLLLVLDLFPRRVSCRR